MPPRWARPAGGDVRAVIARVQEGLAAQADIAAAAGVPYGVVLLHRDAGVWPAADLAPAMRAAGETAAAVALDHAGCVADLSAVHTLQLLPGQAQAAVREQLPALAVSRDTVRDAVFTRDHIRSLGAADFTVTVGPGSPPQPAAIDPADLDLLTRQALHLETVAGELARPVPAIRETAAAEAGIAAAAELGLALWCDDNVLRQRARSRGVPSFSVLDLTTVLRRRGADIGTEDDLARHLADQGVADMPLDGPALIALAAGHDWEPGPASRGAGPARLVGQPRQRLGPAMARPRGSRGRPFPCCADRDHPRRDHRRHPSRPAQPTHPALPATDRHRDRGLPHCGTTGTYRVPCRPGRRRARQHRAKARTCPHCRGRRAAQPGRPAS